MVRQVGEGLYVASREEIEEVLRTLNITKLKGAFVADLGRRYVIVRARKKYVKVIHVSKELVENVAITLAQLKRARVSEIAERVGQVGREVYRALLVLRAYGRVVKQGDYYMISDART